MESNAQVQTTAWGGEIKPEKYICLKLDIFQKGQCLPATHRMGKYRDVDVVLNIIATRSRLYYSASLHLISFPESLSLLPNGTFKLRQRSLIRACAKAAAQRYWLRLARIPNAAFAGLAAVENRIAWKWCIERKLQWCNSQSYEDGVFVDGDVTYWWFSKRLGKYVTVLLGRQWRHSVFVKLVLHDSFSYGLGIWGTEETF